MEWKWEREWEWEWQLEWETEAEEGDSLPGMWTLPHDHLRLGVGAGPGLAG